VGHKAGVFMYNTSFNADDVRIYSMIIKKCLNCGKCCIVLSGSGQWIPCRYRDNKRKICMIYKTRIGKKISENMVCGYRRNLKFNIPGCPYNKTDQPVHPVYLNYL